MKVVKYTIHGSYGYRIHQNFTVCHPLDVLKKNMSGELIWTWTPGPLALWDKTLVILLLRSYSMGPVYRKWVPFNDPCRNPKMKKSVAPSNSKLRQIESHTTSDGFFFIHCLLTCHPFHQFWCPHLLILWARSWKETDIFGKHQLRHAKKPYCFPLYWLFSRAAYI